jgi:hypothetical protein
MANPSRVFSLALVGPRSAPRGRPVAVGLLAAAALSGVYLGIVSLAESPQHAVELFWQDRWLVLPILLTFGVQVGLYAYVRAGAYLAASTAGVSAAGGGLSTAAMVACCAHHLTDVLPILGISLASTFLTAWKTPLMGFGLAANLAGIAVMLWLIRQARRRARHQGLA